MPRHRPKPKPRPKQPHAIDLTPPEPDKPIGANMDRISFFSLSAFGCGLGLLTALNTSNGLTATLIGLLFTFVGTTLMAWFKPDAIPPADRPVLIRYIGSVSFGLLFGLFLGFGCRACDQGYLQPWIAERRDKSLTETRAEFAKVQEAFQAIKNGKPSGDEWKKVDKALERVEKLLATRPAPGTLGGGEVKPVFSVQASEAQLGEASADIKRELDRHAKLLDSDPKKLTRAERESLESFQAALLKSNPMSHITADVAKQVRALLEGDKLSTSAKDAIHGVLKEPS